MKSSLRERFSDLSGSRVGFVSTRIAGKDGVSLEIAKWTEVIERMGMECYFIAGESDRPSDRSVIIQEAHFNHPDVQDITSRAFETKRRDSRLTDDIARMARFIRDQLNKAIDQLGVDVLVVENALTIPMNLPLGVALVQSIQEQRIGCIAHHHDFYWERERFLGSAVEDILRYAFPPALGRVQHVAINSVAGEEFSRRTGLYCRVIPNVMNFANPPLAPDAYAKGLREAIGLDQDDLLILQPTRVVARKGIEHSIELVRRLEDTKAKLVITHAAGDEGNNYANFIDLYSGLMNVKVIFADRWISEHRATEEYGDKLFTLDDVYQQSDLVTYPSEYEGFGNAFLEAVYYRCPILCNRYLIFRTDIEPSGFRTIGFNDILSDGAIAETKRVLRDDRYRQQMVDHNYEIGRRFFSFEILEDEVHVTIRQALRCRGEG